MNSQTLFFSERRDAERALADAAALANVRENHLRAAAAWDALANRASRGDRLREEDQRRKDERSADEAKLQPGTPFYGLDADD